MRVSLGRWLLSLLMGYVVASGLNWAVAEKFLNDIIKPGFGPLMRINANAQVGEIVGGFALLMVMLSLICALLRAPDRWLPTREMCLTATADSFTVIIGALLMTRIQDWR